MTASLDKLKQRCEEEWAKIPPQLCEKLIETENN